MVRARYSSVRPIRWWEDGINKMELRFISNVDQIVSVAGRLGKLVKCLIDAGHGVLPTLIFLSWQGCLREPSQILTITMAPSHQTRELYHHTTMQPSGETLGLLQSGGFFANCTNTVCVVSSAKYGWPSGAELLHRPFQSAAPQGIGRPHDRLVRRRVPNSRCRSWTVAARPRCSVA